MGDAIQAQAEALLALEHQSATTPGSLMEVQAQAGRTDPFTHRTKEWHVERELWLLSILRDHAFPLIRALTAAVGRHDEYVKRTHGWYEEQLAGAIKKVDMAQARIAALEAERDLQDEVLANIKRHLTEACVDGVPIWEFYGCETYLLTPAEIAARVAQNRGGRR